MFSFPPMYWLNIPKYFFELSDTFNDVATSLVSLNINTPPYIQISTIQNTIEGSIHTPSSLTYTYFYITYIIMFNQGGPE